MRRPARAFLVLALVAFAPGCSQAPEAPAVREQSQAPPAAAPAREALPTAATRKMAERLKGMVRAGDPMKNSFRNAERAGILGVQIMGIEDFQANLRARMQLGWELLLAGRNEDAEREFLAVRNAIQQPSLRPGMATIQQIHELLATCYLRMGELQNCAHHHNADSCLVPIQGGGVHQAQRGSRLAVPELIAALENEPENLKYRWLLNIAVMTVGEWPEGVPERWRIGPEKFASDVAFPRFRDASPRLKLDSVGPAGGSVLEDFDGDGWLDVMASSWAVDGQMRYYRSVGGTAFEDRTEAAGLIGELGGLNLTHADYDNDGDSDVLVLRGAWLRDQGRFPNSLLRNRGDATFDDVTEAAGLLTFHPTQAGAWADFDNDGWLDLFIGNESTPGELHPCELFRSNRDGTFTEIAAKVGLAHVGFVKGATWGDYDDDGFPDLYLSRLGDTNILFHNEGPQPGGGWAFQDVTARAGVAEPVKSFPTWFWDYDNDGRLDLFVASYPMFMTDALTPFVKDVLGLPSDEDHSRLYHNEGDGTFRDVTVQVGLDDVLPVMGANHGDLDNDGWLDCYLTTGDPLLTTLIPNRMYRNAGGRAFQDVTTAGGFGHVQKGHGVSFGDFDNDGDQDVFHRIGGAFTSDTFRAALYENPGFGNHWITVHLVGTRSNRSGIGARVRVTVKEGSGTRDIHALVGDGGSFGSSSLQQEIGLGRAAAIESLEVRWPTSGIVQRFQAVEMDATYRVTEGDDALERLRPPQLSAATRKP